MEFVADGFRIFGRDGQEEPGDIWQHLQAAGFGFFREDIAPFLDHGVVMGPFLLDLIQQMFITVDGIQGIHGAPVAVGPAGTAGDLVHVDEFQDLFFVAGHPDQGTAALAIHGEALGQAVSDQPEDVLRQVGQFPEDFPDVFPVAGIVDVGYIQAQYGLLFRAFNAAFQHLDHVFDFFRGQAEPGGVMGRRIDNQQDPVLFGQDFPYLLFTASQVEFVVFRHHGIGIQMAVHIFADILVSAPVPFRSQNGIPGFGIVPHSMVDGTGTAGRGNGFRPGLAEAGVLHQLQVFGQAHDGGIPEVFIVFQAPIDFAHSGQHHKIFVVIQDAADGGIDDIFLTDFADPFLGSFTGTKDAVLGRLPFFQSMRCNTAVNHNSRSSPQ